MQGETSGKVEWRTGLQKDTSVRAVNRRQWRRLTECKCGVASSLAVSLLWAEEGVVIGIMSIQGTLQYFPTLGTLSNLTK